MTFKQGSTVRWLLVDPVSAGSQGYHDPYFENQVGAHVLSQLRLRPNAGSTIKGKHLT